MNRSGVCAIFFDLDDTLLWEESTALAGFGEASALAAEVCDPVQLQRAAQRQADALWREVDAEGWGRRIGISSWEMMWGDFAEGDAPLLRRLHAEAPSLRRRAWQDALRECGCEDEQLAERLAVNFRQFLRTTVQLLPGALEALEALAARFRLGMITNGAPDVQGHKLDAAGLRARFDPLVISGELGVGKPRRGIFEHAVAQVGCAPSQCVMVGNSFNRDVRGALDADWQAVWLNLKDESPPRGNVPFHTITRLDELTTVLARLTGNARRRRRGRE